MKKNLSLMLGLIFLSGGLLMSFSEASRDAYHAYLLGQKNKSQIYFTEGRTKHLKTIKKSKNLDLKNNERLGLYFKNKNFRNSRKNAETNYQKNINTAKKTRTFSTSFRGVNNKKSQITRTSTFSKVLQTKVALKNYSNEDFSLNLPLTVKKGDNNTFATPNKSLSVRIKSFASTLCSKSFGFTGCAVKISKNENENLIEGQGSIYPEFGITRNTFRSDTVLGKVNIQTPVYTENFMAQFPDGERYDLNRYMVKTQENKVYLVETKVNAKKSKNYLGVHKSIFDSFRVK